MLDGSDAADLILDRLLELERGPGWLARKIGVDPAMLTRWLRHGKRIPERRRRDIALVLGKPADWLLRPARPSRELVAGLETLVLGQPDAGVAA